MSTPTNLNSKPLLTDPSNQNNIPLDINNVLNSIELTNNFDFNKIKEFNSKSVELIFEEKIESALEILKKIEIFLEANAIEPKLHLDKKILIIILHNLSCCYQKLKDFENCISYLESVIYHFDSSLEPKHKIKINENYFISSIFQDQSNYSLLGDFILELRFSAKFHLQMCAVLSQANKHNEALKHAKLAALMCEDNLVKTNFLYNQMKNKINENNNNNNNEDLNGFAEKIKQSYKIISVLYKRVIDLRKKKNNSEKEEEEKLKNFNINKLLESNNNNNNNNNNDFINTETSFNSYAKYTEYEIKKNNNNTLLIQNIRKIFGSTIKKDDWIQLLNIGNIMYLSALNYEDLDLDSDPKYELIRDAILEKVVMLTVSYFCIATEMRFLCADKNDNKINGEFYHYKAVEFSSLFLPVSCPIVKHYIFSYYKHYGNDMECVPEGKIVEVKIDLIRSEIEVDKDCLSFICSKKINYVNKIVNNGSLMIGNKNFKNIKTYNNNNNINNNVNNNNVNNNNNNNSNSGSSQTNIHYDLLPGKNYLQIASKSKLKEAPNFKLNFNNLHESNSSIRDNNNNNNNNLNDHIKVKHINKKNNINNNNNNNMNNSNTTNDLKTERIKISKKHLNNHTKTYNNNNKIAKTARHGSANNSHNHTNNNNHFNINNNSNRSGAMTARINSSNKLNSKGKNNSSNKASKTQRDYYHSSEKILVNSNNRNKSTNSVKKPVSGKNNSNNRIHSSKFRQPKYNFKNNLIKSSNLIDILLANKINEKQQQNNFNFNNINNNNHIYVNNNNNNSNSINNLIKVLKPKKKVSASYNYGINSNNNSKYIRKKL